MKVQERRIGDVVVIALSGQLTLGDGDVRLKDKINSLLLEGVRNIVLDLGDVTYIDSSGLGQLVSSFTSVTRTNGRLALVKVGRHSQDLLIMTKLVTVLDTYDTQDEAINSFETESVVVSLGRPRHNGRGRRIMTRKLISVVVFMLSIVYATAVGPPSQAVAAATADGAPTTVYHRTMEIDGLDIFYREAGDQLRPTVLLLHGFPTSSHMFRNLIPALADEFHLIAPDYPGYGNSSMPSVDEFDYTFDHLADIVSTLIERLGVDRYTLYLMDYGAPVGFRLAVRHPERVQALVIQNGNTYDEGLDNNFWEPIKAYWKDRGAINQGLDNDFWKNVKVAYNQPKMSNDNALRFLVTLGATQWQYTNGVRDAEVISPDNWHVTQRLLDRPGNEAIQLQLFYDYGSNPPLYPSWQEHLRTYQPPTLITWGQNDEIFPAAGAHPYKRDLETLEFHLFDTGHFALEEDGEEIAQLMRRFLRKHVD